MQVFHCTKLVQNKSEYADPQKIAKQMTRQTILYYYLTKESTNYQPSTAKTGAKVVGQ
jgi:hypothetical protein